MKRKVFIRVDGGFEIGLGHLVRSIALAHMLKNDFKISFYCIAIPDSLKKELADNHFDLKLLIRERDFLDYLNKEIIAVLDGYLFSTEYQQEIKSKGAKLICIDDLHDREFCADLIINHSPGITPQDYQAQSYTQFALGPEYALLRPLFLANAKAMRKIEKIRTVLICFGGSDPKNLTEKTMRIILKFDEFERIIVITGPSYRDSATLTSYEHNDTRIHHFHCIDERTMLKLMEESDLAIVPASSVLFEVIASGCKPLICSYTKDQESFYKYMVNEYRVNFFECSADQISGLDEKIVSMIYKNSNSKIDEFRKRIGRSRENICQAINNII